MPPLVSYIGVPARGKAREVGDVSDMGFYMLTRERWTLGTFLPVSLERTDLFGTHRGEFITVQALVVHNGDDGVGFTFLLGDEDHGELGTLASAHWVTKGRMADFLMGLRQSEAEEAKERPRAF